MRDYTAILEDTREFSSFDEKQLALWPILPFTILLLQSESGKHTRKLTRLYLFVNTSYGSSPRRIVMSFPIGEQKFGSLEIMIHRNTIQNIVPISTP